MGSQATTTAPALLLHEALRIARNRTDLDQKDVAKQIGVTQKTISRWENGLSDPPYPAVIRLVSLYASSSDQTREDLNSLLQNAVGDAGELPSTE